MPRQSNLRLRNTNLLLICLILVVQSWNAVGPQTTPLQGTSGTQNWCRVAYKDGNSAFVCWSGGGESFARGFVRSVNALNPSTGTIHCNTTTLAQQDECEIAVSRTGTVLIAWSDRSSTYTEYMNANACLLAPDGSFIRHEFSLSDLTSHEPNASKWRPLVHSLRNGGFVATWTSGWDEEVVLRTFSSLGQPLMPDTQINPIQSNSQDYPDVAEGKNGNLIFVYNNFAGSSPADVYARITNFNGTPITNPILAPGTVASGGDEREPRVASNQRGGFVIIWIGNDGSGKGIIARAFRPSGMPLGDPFVVNQATQGLQRDPQIGMDRAGNWMVVWADDYSNTIQARYFDASIGAFEDQFPVNEIPLGPKYSGEKGRRTPSLSILEDGSRVLFGWSGANGSDSANLDVWIKEYAR